MIPAQAPAGPSLGAFTGEFGPEEGGSFLAEGQRVQRHEIA